MIIQLYTKVRAMFLCLILNISLLSANGTSFSARPLAEVLDDIGAHYHVLFSYDQKLVKGIQVNFDFRANETFEIAVNRALKGTSLKYKSFGKKYYVLYKNTNSGTRKMKQLKKNIKKIEAIEQSNEISLYKYSNEIDALELSKSATKIAAAKTVTGQVLDENGMPLVGVNIQVNQHIIGTSTDVNGQFSLNIPNSAQQLTFSYVGYETKETVINRAETIKIILSAGISVDEIIVTGTRAPNRTNTAASAPVDVINVSKLYLIAPQNNINQLLNYSIPSFSSNSQTIADGSDHVDPASLRGLGPDQVLVLINGKRRHTSSLVNVNGTFGRGSVGTDLNTIPLAALETIEVLRDGAAAQYGSDAIAGVINLRLREDVKTLNININTGANFSKNAVPENPIDGEVLELGINYGLPIGKKRGFINFSGSVDYRGTTNRTQQYSGKIFNAYNAIEWAAYNDGANLANLSIDDIQSYAQQVLHFDETFKQSINASNDINQLRTLLQIDVTEEELLVRDLTRNDFNIKFGQSELRDAKFFINTKIPINDKLTWYAFGGSSFRDGQSGCFYRLPYQSRTFTSSYINGFLPIINAKITDHSITTGITGNMNGWKTDFSIVNGYNQFLFLLKNTHNATLQTKSPVKFDAGGHSFHQLTNNVDISKYFELTDINGLNIAFGGEFRYENYKIIPGSEMSFGVYDRNGGLVNKSTPDDLLVTDFFGRSRPSGCQCFPGFMADNQVNADRTSISGYADVEFDISDDWRIETAARFENYSDFGSNFSYKISTSYLLNPFLAIRSVASTGFRAPSLHQIHYSRTGTIFETKNGMTSAHEVGVYSNQSRAAALLGIPTLKQESSRNYSMGVAGKLSDYNLKFTVDAYLIHIKDRIVLTGQFSPKDDADLLNIFEQVQANRAAFFANAIDTRSGGLDIVITQNINIKESVLSTNFAATVSQTRQVGEINASELLESKGLVDVYFDETSRIYLEEAVPRTKVTLSNTWSLNKFTAYIRNTYFGSTTEPTNISTLDPAIHTTYSGKILTDVSVSYLIKHTFQIVFGSNNLFDIYPDKAHQIFQSDGRFPYSRRSPQFSYGGRHVFGRVVFLLN